MSDFAYQTGLKIGEQKLEIIRLEVENIKLRRKVTEKRYIYFAAVFLGSIVGNLIANHFLR